MSIVAWKRQSPESDEEKTVVEVYANVLSYISDKEPDDIPQSSYSGTVQLHVLRDTTLRSITRRSSDIPEQDQSRHTQVKNKNSF